MAETPLLWRGEMTTRRALTGRGLGFLSPGMLWLIGFLVLPSLLFIVLSFAERGVYGEVVWNFSLANYKRLAGFGTFGWTPDYLLILGRSVLVAFVTTSVSILLAYPLTFFIASRPPRSRFMWLIILIIPLGFRMTCYYYRKAYYRSFWMSPPACAVPDKTPVATSRRYTGETRFPLILMNAHISFAITFPSALIY